MVSLTPWQTCPPKRGEVEATEENIWTVKGCDAPGASTLETRLEVMDMMGIERQLVFPQAVAGILIWSGDEHAVEAMRRYNDFVMEWTKGSRGRATCSWWCGFGGC